MIRITGKIPLTIYPSFWILALLIGILSGGGFFQIFLWMGIVLVSVVVHEFGHALSGILCGQKVQIELWAFGGLTYHQGKELNKLQEFFIVVMGPFFGFLLAMTALLAMGFVPAEYVNVHFALFALLWANVFWTVANLLPVHPMDGGKILGIICESIFGRQGFRYSFLVSAFCAFALFILCLSYRAVIPACFFLLFTYESYKEFKRLRGVLHPKQEQAVLDEMHKAQKEWQEGSQEVAIDRLKKVTSSIQGENSALDALYQLAKYYNMKEEYEKAYNALIKAKEYLSVDGNLLLQYAAYKSKRYEEAILAGKKAFLEEANSDAAVLNAFASAQLKHFQEAINWLQYVKEMGVLDFKKVLQSEDLDPIRSDPAFLRFSK